MSSKVNTNDDFQFNFNNIILSTDTEFSPRRNLDKNEHTIIDNTNKHQPRINNNSVDDDEINAFTTFEMMLIISFQFQVCLIHKMN